MNIVLVYWKIKKDKKVDFENYWSNLKVEGEDSRGLFREFLSQVDENEEKINTWDLSSSDCLTYINVGIWRSSEAFKRAIQDYMKSPKQPFEAKRRRRVVLDSVRLDRGGLFELPPAKIEP